MGTGSVEEELCKFCETWNNVREVLVSNLPPEFSKFLGKRFNCEIKGGECFALEIGPEGARVRKGRDEWAHATICMDEEDWLNVLKGEYGIWSVMISGRLALDLNESQLAIMLGYLLQACGLMSK